jgi:DNA modification methylase/rubredoxin
MAKQKQADLELQSVNGSEQVEVLGKTFSSDEERRNYFLAELAEKLKDPEFRKASGFPMGDDEDILALSDPPFFTVCPNPWISDLALQFGTAYDAQKSYHREPFVADVNEGKTDAIYKAHAYHTKTPHKAIMRFLLHYTEPGDLVLDGFSGTGLTGVAARLCGSEEEIRALGYRSLDGGKVVDEEGHFVGGIGSRRVILNDLSPVAAFIAYNLNTPFDIEEFRSTATDILDSFNKQCGWMYTTAQDEAGTKGKGQINFTVWSEVFACPECAGEIVFTEVAVNDDDSVKSAFRCPQCDAALTKKKVQKVYENRYDSLLKRTVRHSKRVPVLINYSDGTHTRERKFGEFDAKTLARIEQLPFPSRFPSDRIMHAPDDVEIWGDKWRAGTASFTHVHHLFSARSARALSWLWSEATKIKDKRLRNILYFTFEQAVWGMSHLARYTPTHYSQVNQYLSGVYYVASQIVECSPDYLLRGKIDRLCSTFSNQIAPRSDCAVSTGDAASIPIPSCSIDYIFIDPPFGHNLAYAELNFLIEAFLRVFTSKKKEAIISPIQKKELGDYHSLMSACFQEYYRVLKPGRWITIEFSNTQSSVWNAIQSALQEAGFVVANVAALNKQQRGFNAIVTPTSVKQDLVISAYKPNGGLESRFAKKGRTEDGVWDFIRTHLQNLPVVKPKGGQLEPIAERDARILYDRTVAFYVRHGIPVPLSSAEFQATLAEKFPERDGMYFLAEQAVQYDSVRVKMEGIGQLTIFVEDERSAVNWLRSQLKDKPSKYQDIMPEFFEQLNQSWKKWETRPELRALLDQYFLCYHGDGPVPAQIHSYLSSNFKDLRNLQPESPVLLDRAADRWYVPDPKKNADVEQLREKRLLDEFWSYLPAGYEPAWRRKGIDGPMLPGIELPAPKIPKGKRLTLVRTEAVRVGFKFCFQRNDYETILAVAQYVPEDVINNDEQLQMLYDVAITRTSGEIE